MGWTELKTYRPWCDACRIKGPKTYVDSYPGKEDLPEGWGPRTLTDCGLTGYTRHEILCPTCLSLHEKREDGKARQHA